MITGSDMPPEIREIVDEAGVGNCFYYSDRWRQSTKPSDGEPASEMPNTVPGSPIEATQSTDSAKPIAANEGFSFEGDDYFAGNGAITENFDQYTIATVARNRDTSLSGNAYVYAQRDTTSGDFSQIYMSFRGTDSVQVTVRDDAEATNNHNVEIGDNTTTFAAVSSVDLSGGRTYLTSENGSTTVSEESTYSLGSITGADEVLIGAISGGSGPIDGVTSELLIVPTLLIPDAQADALRDRMAWRHDL